MCGWRRGRRQCSWQRQIRAHAAVTISELREAAVGQPVFMAERTRRALAKLTVEERWLFSTTLRAGPFEDLLYSDDQLVEEISGVQVARKRKGATAGTVLERAQAGRGTQSRRNWHRMQTRRKAAASARTSTMWTAEERHMKGEDGK